MKLTIFKKEWFLLVVAWTLVFVYHPLYMYYADYVSHMGFSWSKVFMLWSYSALFLAVFLVHHCLLIPKLMMKKRYGLYTLGVVACLVLFTWVIVLMAPAMDPYPEVSAARVFRPLLAPPDLARLLIIILMMGVDLGAVALINEQKLRQRLLQLEKQNLKQELDHLRYQINPHFFMNTLNNIHVLVDIDQERAKRAIVELSGLMRYSLYQGDESMAPLQHEMDFLHQYISLMKLRFNDNVSIDFEHPEEPASGVMLPPLLLGTFVENAFKHGISYQQPSFVTISLSLEKENSEIHFRCTNSRFANPSSTPDGHHGIGLANVQKRLQLQYGESYSLVVDDSQADRYTIDLRLPSTPSTNQNPRV